VLGYSWGLVEPISTHLRDFCQLIHQGVPPNRLVAAGFGEFQPVDNGDRLKLTEK
jgi:flagellar motor protein MotB